MRHAPAFSVFEVVNTMQHELLPFEVVNTMQHELLSPRLTELVGTPCAMRLLSLSLK